MFKSLVQNPFSPWPPSRTCGRDELAGHHLHVMADNHERPRLEGLLMGDGVNLAGAWNLSSNHFTTSASELRLPKRYITVNQKRTN